MTVLVLLTVGIGVSTAIFSAVDAIVLRSLPFVDARTSSNRWADR
jgi:hypothetical protein